MKRDHQGKRLQNTKIAIIASDYFEEVELTKPRDALRTEGAETILITPKGRRIMSMNHDEKGSQFEADLSLTEADADDFDAVLLPGGAMNADRLRMNIHARDFIRRIDEIDKPIAAICHAPWILVSAGLVKGRMLTSYYTLQDDIRNAGGRWLDMEVVHDWNWVSSRDPNDLPAFIDVMTTLFEQYCRADIDEAEVSASKSN